MALSGNYTTLDEVLRRVRFQSGEIIDIDEAAEWVSDILEMVSPQDMLVPIITDGNPSENHPEPVEVIDYKAKIPCDAVLVTSVFELSSFTNMRESLSTSHRINMTKTPNAGKYSEYNPNFWNKKDTRKDLTFQVKKGHIYTSFEKGHIIIAYWGWPMDADGNLMVPSDKKIVRALASYIQYKIDYKLWRSGDINERIYRDSEQAYMFDIAAADSYSKMPTEARMESIKNYMRSFVSNDKNFSKHFVSLGQSDR
jgi:hypothetical protein